MERVVIVEKLKKNFRVREKDAGLLASFKSLASSSYKNINALKSISFSLNKGEMVGFIGPNGAGKTTTLKILSGILYPTSGFVQVMGFTPWERKYDYLNQLGLIMGQKNQLWWDLPAIDSLELNRAIYNLSDKKYKKNLQELTEILDVADILRRPVRHLSLGQRMRLELVAGLLHSPQVVFLDEPTVGLDVVAQAKIREFIKEYNKNHEATVILTSHNMNDLLGIVDRVIIIDKGSIFFDGKLESLVKKYALNKIITATLINPVRREDLEKIGSVVEYEFPKVVLAVKRTVATLAASELLQNYPVSDLNIEEVPVEQIIVQIFQANAEK